LTVATGLAATVPGVAEFETSPARPRLAARLRVGMRRRSNWYQLVRFAIVGASGYVVNLATFALVVGPVGLGYRVGAILAFVVALANNFWWNRQWTFRGHGGRLSHQAGRFVGVSLAAFVLAFLVLEALVSLAGVPELAAQAISVACATPFNFLGNRLWTFRAGR
jgi:dolichol-phosphate mannosyltransferase